MKALKRAVVWITKVELAVEAAAFAVMVICYFVSVVNRNIIRASMPWTEELGVYCMVYMSLLGMEIGLRDGTQVSVTALTDKLEGTAAGRILSLVANAVLLIFVFIMCRYGLALVMKQLQSGQTSPVMKVPMYILYLSLVISFGITLLTQVMIFAGKLFRVPMNEITDADGIIDGFSWKGGH